MCISVSQFSLQTYVETEIFSQFWDSHTICGNEVNLLWFTEARGYSSASRPLSKLLYTTESVMWTVCRQVYGQVSHWVQPLWPVPWFMWARCRPGLIRPSWAAETQICVLECHCHCHWK